MGSASVYHACSLEFDSTQELWGHCGKAVPVGTGPREPRLSLLIPLSPMSYHSPWIKPKDQKLHPLNVKRKWMLLIWLASGLQNIRTQHSFWVVWPFKGLLCLGRLLFYCVLPVFLCFRFEVALEMNCNKSQCKETKTQTDHIQWIEWATYCSFLLFWYIKTIDSIRIVISFNHSLFYFHFDNLYSAPLTPKLKDLFSNRFVSLK